MNKKIYFPVICYNHNVLCHFMFSSMKLANDCMIKNISMSFDCIFFDSLVARARNAAAAGFLNSNATHMLFIDSDISFRSSDVFSMLEKDKEVICGVYPKKYINKKKLDYISKLMYPLPDNYESLCTNFATEIKRGQAQTVDYAATGFMLIARTALEKIIKKFPNIKYKNDIDGYHQYGDNFYNFFPCEINQQTKKYESEDYGFSRLWRETGGEIFVDNSICLTHYGWKGYEGNLTEQIKIFK